MSTSAGMKAALQVLECFTPPAVFSEPELQSRTGLSVEILRDVLTLLGERGYLLRTHFGSYHLSPHTPFVPANDFRELRQTHVSDGNPSGLGALVVVDTDGIIRHVSEGFLHLWLCRDYSEVIGRSSLDIWHERDKVKVALSALVERNSWRGVLIARRSDGDTFPLDVSALTVKAEGKDMCSLVFVSRRFERSGRECSFYREGGGVWMPDLLTRSILHDMNNIWSVILGNLSLLKLEMGGDDGTEDMVADTQSACRLSFKMIHRIFDSPGVGADRWQVLAPGELITSAVRAGLSGSKLTRNVNLPDDLALIYCDEAEMFRALLNVMINARQAMKENGHLDVSASNVTVVEGEKPSLAQGSYVRIVISDSGMGMPEEHLGKIFTPYFTTKETGSGLGLFVLSSIIKVHGGCVEVNSQQGKGTDFIIYLPTAPGNR